MTLTKSSTGLTALTFGVAALVAIVFATVSVAPAHAASICPGTTFSANLRKGSTGMAVMQLQQFLNSSPDTMIASVGAGSPGNETTYLGGLTTAAIKKFQTKYASNVLAPVGLSVATGYWGASSRAEANALCAGTAPGTNPGTGTTTPGTAAGTAVVSAAVQPANAIAPANAARVPFTNFTITANGAPVTINSVTVQRQGPSVDTDLSGVVLINASTGVQLGSARVLDANHSATIGQPITIPAGSSMTFQVAGNIANSSTFTGDVASFAVTAINTSSSVSGSLPIVGASNTFNGNLTIGTATVNTSSFDPNNATSQPIGTTGYRFSGIRIQAGSAEDVTFKSITWYQSGSASGLSNVVTVVNGTSYPTTVDATGRYYTSVFPTGIVIPKGQSLDVYVQGDLGANTTANTYAEFDIYRNTDIYLVGNTYGYGITPTTGATTGSYSSTSSHGTIFVSGTNPTPYFQGSTVSVTAGQFSTIQNATSVGSQNIAVNVANQPLGGFQTNLTGEAIQVQSLKVHFTSSVAIAPLQNVSLVNQNGVIVSGPYNATCDVAAGTNGICGSAAQTVTFSGATNFPTGSNTYTLKGQVQSGTGNAVTIVASTNPSTDWTNVTGQTTGNNISINVTNFTMNTMTVKTAALTVGNSTTPTAQTIVAGGSGVLFAGVQLDASQSGEDVRLSSIPVTLAVNGAANVTSDISACQLFNGTTALNTGSRVINSSNLSSTTSQTVTFSLDNSLTVPKGTVLTLNLRCNLSSSANNGATYQFSAGTPSATGAVSGNSVTVTLANGSGPVMTASSGATLAASLDSSAPAYTVVAGGSTGVTLNVIKFRATNEAVNLQKVGLTLTNASSSPSDLTQVYLYAGNNIYSTTGTAIAAGTLLGTASFTGTATVATSTLTSPVQLPNNTDATIFVKADIAQIGVSQPANEGDLVALDYLNSQGTGANSGKTIYGTGSTASAGIRIFKTTLTVAAGPAAPANPNGANQVLKKFSITAGPNGAAGLYQLEVSVATSSANVTNLQLHAYTDTNYSQIANVPGSTSGQFGSTATPNGNTYTAVFTNSNPFEIGAGQTVYFTLTGNVAVTGSNNWTVTATLLGDNAYPTGISNNNMGTAAQVAAVSTFVWSPNATSTATAAANDWTNSYGMSGLPSTGL